MQTLAFTGGLIEGDGGAAALLGLKPSTLRTRMNKEGITRAAALLAARPTVLPTDSASRCTFKELPPRARAASFTLSDAMEKIETASRRQN